MSWIWKCRASLRPNHRIRFTQLVIALGVHQSDYATPLPSGKRNAGLQRAGMLTYALSMKGSTRNRNASHHMPRIDLATVKFWSLLPHPSYQLKKWYHHFSAMTLITINLIWTNFRFPPKSYSFVFYKHYTLFLFKKFFLKKIKNNKIFSYSLKFKNQFKVLLLVLS